MNFKKAFNFAAIVALALIGATGCGGGSSSSNNPRWSHGGRTGYYVVVTSCVSYYSLACYCDSTGCWYDNSGWYDVGGGYYTGYWPSTDTSYYGNSSNSSGYYTGGSTNTSSYGNSSNSSGYYSGSTNTSSYGNSSNTSGSYYGNSTNTSAYGNSSNSSGYYYSADGKTKDVDLQNADLQKQDLNTRAQALASQFQMNYDAALQLTQLSDKFNKLSVANKLTDEDRAAIIDSTLGVAGISKADVDAAIQARVVDGNEHALDDLLEKGAKNIGMPNSAGIRDQILPSLGMKL
jgi:hypothetical protein